MIHERVLVVPLIGAIDDDRAAEITENLLHEVVLRKARIILVDVTGVSGIDGGVAALLARTARAVRLIGAQVVLVCIRPDLATVLVDAGIDLACRARRRGLPSWRRRGSSSVRTRCRGCSRCPTCSRSRS